MPLSVRHDGSLLVLAPALALFGCGASAVTSSQAPASHTLASGASETVRRQLDGVPTDLVFTRIGACAECEATIERVVPNATTGAYEFVQEGALSDRTPIRDEDVRDLYAFVVAHRAELEATCRDEAVSYWFRTAFSVTADGETMSFECLSATTPAFTELASRFASLAPTHEPFVWPFAPAWRSDLP